MVSLKKKTIKGHNYWYAVEMSRVNGKPKQTWQMYLGTAEKIVEAMKGSEGKPYAKKKSFEYGKIAAMMHLRTSTVSLRRYTIQNAFIHRLVINRQLVLRISKVNLK